MESNSTLEKISPLQRTMSKRYDVLLRLLLIGETGVGKTCVLCRYASEEFVESHITTIGIDFKMKTISLGGKTIKVQIWDTAGQERFESITKQFYRRAQGVILVYDITSKNTFEAVSKWLSYVRQFGREDVSILLMGNKNDKAENRQVPEEEGRKFAKENNLLFYETSAKDSANLEKITKMDQLSEIRKGVRVQYMEEIKKDLWVEGYSAEEQKEKRPEMLLDEHQARLQQINGEFKVYYKQRNTDALRRAVMQLEEVNTNRQKACQEEEKRRRTLENVLVELVRRIRRRRNPCMAKKIMLMLLDHHENLRKLHQELRMRIHQKEERQKERNRHLLQKEIMKKAQEIEKRILLKIQMKNELMLKVKVMKREKTN